MSSSAIYMLRTMQQHHVALSAMADQKANIMIGGCVGILIFSLGKLETGYHPAWIIALCATAMLAGLFAAIAVKPNFKPSKRASLDQSNPLFFGHFVHIDEASFQQYITAQLATDDTVYKAMMHDIYQLGQALYFGKYRYLSYSYSVFLTGIFITLLLGLRPTLLG